MSERVVDRIFRAHSLPAGTKQPDRMFWKRNRDVPRRAVDAKTE